MTGKIDPATKPRYSRHIPDDDPRLQLFDYENPRSLINLAPESMVEGIRECMRRMPKLLICTEGVIKDTLKPDERDDIVRMRFWEEYNHCSAPTVPTKMSLTPIRGFVNPKVFHKVYTNNRWKLAWIITPPKSYAETMRRILDYSMDRLLEVVRLPIMLPDGTPDYKLIEKIIKIAQITDLRVKGAIPQTIRMDQRNLNLNVDATKSQPALGVSVEQLLNLPMDELEALSKKSSKLAGRIASPSDSNHVTLDMGDSNLITPIEQTPGTAQDETEDRSYLDNPVDGHLYSRKDEVIHGGLEEFEPDWKYTTYQEKPPR